MDMCSGIDTTGVSGVSSITSASVHECPIMSASHAMQRSHALRWPHLKWSFCGASRHSKGASDCLLAQRLVVCASVSMLLGPAKEGC